MCVCEREREREGVRKRERKRKTNVRKLIDSHNLGMCPDNTESTNFRWVAKCSNKLSHLARAKL